jgi:hypothetical protein
MRGDRFDLNGTGDKGANDDTAAVTQGVHPKQLVRAPMLKVDQALHFCAR